MAPPAVDVLLPFDPLASFEPDHIGTAGDYYSQGLRRRFQIDGLQSATPEPTPGQYADIGYDFDEAKYSERVMKSEALLRAGKLPTSLPDGWPRALSGPLVWSSNSFPDDNEYVYCLTGSDKQEILQALEYFKNQGLNGEEVSRDNFPLPKLGEKLDEICSSIYYGRGFAIVRGLDLDSYGVGDLTVVYLGISSYIGERRGKQDQRGSMIMHVIKRGDARGEQYDIDKPFHTDTVTDCLCLFSRGLAPIGGESVLASAWTVYNEIAATRPYLIHVLARGDWPFDTFGRDPPFYKRALLFHHDSKVMVSFGRRLLLGHLPHERRTPGIPGLTELQAEAIDAMHYIARKHEIKTTMKPGDLRFVNNMAVMHRRAAFENSADQQRHLIRLWLNNEMMCWKLPAPLRIAWARVFEDDERQAKWDIVPPTKNGVILRVAGSCD